MMRRILFLGSLLLFCITIYGQESTNNIFRNELNQWYWKNRKPHAAYWQQDIAYTIMAEINERSNIISAHQQLQYWNNSPDTLSFVYFHLYQNAFIKGSHLEALYKGNKRKLPHLGYYLQQGLGTVVKNIQVDGIACKSELDNTLLKVYLPKKLAPESTIVFDMDFTTYFDQTEYRRRMAAFPSWGFMHYNGVHWYPRISVYDSKKGWDTDQHLNKELYGDYGSFDVTLNFAANYIVEATGELQNESDMYPADLRKKLDVKNFVNKPWNEKPSTIIPYDSSKRKSWHFVANNVHDFAFTANPHYRISETICELPYKNKTVKCIGLVVEPHAAKWQNSSSLIASMIGIISNEFGDYEYPKIVAADANDGMEYPMLALCGGASPDYRGVFAHEIGHNWFYGMIGNNETYRAALDEGFTQFLTARCLQKLDGDTVVKTYDKNKYKARHRKKELNIDRHVYNRYMQDAIRSADKHLNTHSNDFHSAIGHENGYSNVYHKMATMLYNLEYVLGDSLFEKAMKHYVAQWKFAHPYLEDFRQSFISYTHQDLNWFFDQWMETTKNVDYGIRSVIRERVKDKFTIIFHRKGSMQMPIDFTVTSKLGKQYTYHIPNSVFTKSSKATALPKWYGWDLLNPRYKASLQIPDGIQSIQIDTSNRLADINMLNNYYQYPMLPAPKAISFQLDKFLQQPTNWKKYNLTWRPDIWWNPVDGLKTGLHAEGNYAQHKHIFYATAWLNTRLLSDIKYRALEGESWWANSSVVDYTLRYETPLHRNFSTMRWGFSSRSLDAYKRHSIFYKLDFNPKNKVIVEAVSLWRNGRVINNHLFAPTEWSSFLGDNINSQRNTYLHLQFQHLYQCKFGNGIVKLSSRTPFTYNYAYLQTEGIHKNTIHKVDITTRSFARLGFGNSIPSESALYLQGANPEEMMEDKFTRSQGFIPASYGAFSTTDFGHLHAGGGLNLRGYTGYYAIDEGNGGIRYLNYKGQGGASMNIEMEFDRYFKFRPKYLRDYIHVDAYLFGDAGLIRRGVLNTNNIPSLQPTSQWSKIRTDAGIGAAITIKKFGPFETIQPFTLRIDWPLFISAPTNANPIYWDAKRWIIGIGRAW